APAPLQEGHRCSAPFAPRLAASPRNSPDGGSRGLQGAGSESTGGMPAEEQRSVCAGSGGAPPEDSVVTNPLVPAATGICPFCNALLRLDPDGLIPRHRP